MFIRGLIPAEHEYIVKIIEETCYTYGFIVAKEVLIPPKFFRVDLIALKDNIHRLFEVTTPENYTKRKRIREKYVMHVGPICYVNYLLGVSPDRKEIEKQVIQFLINPPQSGKQISLTKKTYKLKNS
jgi:hypothetical protein